MPAFPFSANVLPVLNKIDQIFVALLRGSQENTAHTFGVKNVPSRTDKVRIKSLVEETRVAAVNCAVKSGISADFDDSSDDEALSEPSSFQAAQNYSNSSVSAGLGRIFKGTIEILGDSLTGV
jgi:hypothetical protein